MHSSTKGTKEHEELTKPLRHSMLRNTTKLDGLGRRAYNSW